MYRERFVRIRNSADVIEFDYCFAWGFYRAPIVKQTSYTFVVVVREVNKLGRSKRWWLPYYPPGLQRNRLLIRSVGAKSDD